jgi:hypothetical protein
LKSLSSGIALSNNDGSAPCSNEGWDSGTSLNSPCVTVREIFSRTSD